MYAVFFNTDKLLLTNFNSYAIKNYFLWVVIAKTIT